MQVTTGAGASRAAALLSLTFTLLVALGPSAQAATDDTVRITLLHVSDVYEMSPVDNAERGGLARLATLKRQILAESPHALLLLSGDTIAPSVASTLFKGAQMIAAWNAVGLDYAVLGNHEFDFGDTVLTERIKESRFAWLAANIIDRKTGKPFGDMPPYVIREFDGVKIGLFGLLTPDTRNISKPSPDVEFLAPCETAARLTKELRDRGVRVIVALTHLTMREDKQVAHCAPIDVIIGGHEHTILQSLSGRTPIFKVDSDARNLGRVDLHVSTKSGEIKGIDWEVTPVTKAVQDDPKAKAIVDEYEKQLAADLDRPIGRTENGLDARQATNRTRETNLGDFISDMYRLHTGADIALVNSGAIRSNRTYGPGALSKRDVRSILPFQDTVVKVDVSGATVRTALEHSVSRIAEEKEAGRFLQISGLRFTYDGRRSAGSRIVSVTVNGESLDDRKTYTVALTSFLLQGGDGYTLLRGARPWVKPEDAWIGSEIVIHRIASAETIAPQTDGRITRLDEAVLLQ